MCLVVCLMFVLKSYGLILAGKLKKKLEGRKKLAVRNFCWLIPSCKFQNLLLFWCHNACYMLVFMCVNYLPKCILFGGVKVGLKRGSISGKFSDQDTRPVCTFWPITFRLRVKIEYRLWHLKLYSEGFPTV